MQSSHKQIISFGAPPANPYSVAVKGGGFIYLSGTLAGDTDDPSTPSDVGSETRRTLERMRDVLIAAGSSLDDVVAVMVYLTSASDFQAMNQAYRAFWPGDPPTRTTVITSLVVTTVIAALDRRIVLISLAALLAISGTLVALATNFLVMMTGRAMAITSRISVNPQAVYCAGSSRTMISDAALLA